MKEEILENMAKAFFACAWADAAERTGNSSMLSGCEILDIMPREIDPSAVRAANKVCEEMERLNNATIESLYAKVSDRISVEKFGHYSAMQAMGTGVGLGECKIGRNEVKVPYHEFSDFDLDKTYFAENNSNRKPRP